MATVLVIDDSTFQRKWLTRVFENLGHEVVTANNGREGLDKLESSRPDMITVDLNMPEMDGFQFLANLQDRDMTVPTIVITSDCQTETEKQCRQLGAVAFLNKPFKPQELESAVELCFSKQEVGNNQ